MPTPQAKRFALSINNAAEDVPRLITCYGKCCGGELALVIRPHETRATFIKVMKEKALTWWSENPCDVPMTPTREMSSADAIHRIKADQAGLPKVGPITFKGQWKGHLVCQEDGHHVELVRKVSGYATVVIVGSKGKWQSTVHRDAKWFGQKKEHHGKTTWSLQAAIMEGYTLALGTVAEACSVRDTTRRAARDPEYQKQCGDKTTGSCAGPSRDRPDPLTRLGKGTKATRKTASAAQSATVPPQTDLTTQATKVERGAKALTSVTEPQEALRRAKRLIEAAERMAGNELCQGPDLTRAQTAIRVAWSSYSAGVKLLEEGQPITKHLKKVADELALSAARIAQACAKGAALPTQQDLAEARAKRSLPGIKIFTITPSCETSTCADKHSKIKNKAEKQQARRLKDGSVDPTKDRVLKEALMEGIKQIAADL